MKIKNWGKFQHYDKRRPLWIKLYRDILDDIKIYKLSDGAFRFLINSILLASEDFGELPECDEIAFRLRLDKDKVNKYLQEIDYCIEHDDSEVLADCYQDASLEKEKEKEKEKDINKSSPKTVNDVPYKKIVETYHKMLPTLPKVEKLTATRKGQIKQRWRQDLKDLNQWENYFDYVSQSKFLMGLVPSNNGRKPFIATLEWLTKESNFTKVSEENYHG